MLDRRPVTRETVLPLAALKVRPDQPRLVAENAVTIAQAAHEPGAQVWGLWEAGRPVGLMAMVDRRAGVVWHPEDDRETAYLWRLMIDGAAQGKGHGRAALCEALRQTRDWGLPRLVATVVDEPHSNLGFYLKFGFRCTGRVVDGEIEIALDA